LSHSLRENGLYISRTLIYKLPDYIRGQEGKYFLKYELKEGIGTKTHYVYYLYTE